jgi:Predicted dienelactone hydrolase
LATLLMWITPGRSVGSQKQPISTVVEKSDASLTLPRPTGASAIGTKTVQLTDPTRPAPMAGPPGRVREIMVQLWYPSPASRRVSEVPYLSSATLLAAMKREMYLDLAFDTLEKWSRIRTHASSNVPLVRSPKRMPLVIFSPGMGMSRASYTSFYEDLASHGYVVAAIDHPYCGLTVLQDGRVLSNSSDKRGPRAGAERVEAMAQDARFVLSRLVEGRGALSSFAGRIDPVRAAIAGHSLGGAAALEACRNTGSFRVCMDFDGDSWGKVDREGVGCPYMVMLNEPGESHRPPPAMRKQRDEQWFALASKRNTPALVVKVNGTFHLSFSDIPFLVPNELITKQGADLPASRCFEIVARSMRAFLAEHGMSPSRENMKDVARSFPELELTSFN